MHTGRIVHDCGQAYFQQQQKQDESEPEPDLGETETEVLAETDPVEPHKGVPSQDEPNNVKGPGHAKKAGNKNVDKSEQDEPSFGGAGSH